mmetsp:Transcript_17992/g.44445  ORF Transcript_17992/g.44445 Transcript_17992/m.44445 type:complete len:166 (+) Transcript_17992:808-1305(+)
MHVRGTIVKRTSPDPTQGETSPKAASKPSTKEPMDDRKTLVSALFSCCNGLAIPLKGTDKRFPILGCALLGHGGQYNTKKDEPRNTSGGTAKPIFVSVGHRVSLTRAIQITASLCQYRIPEPVRIADLYGRELMRSSADKSNNNVEEKVDPMIVEGDRKMASVVS